MNPPGWHWLPLLIVAVVSGGVGCKSSSTAARRQPTEVAATLSNDVVEKAEAAISSRSDFTTIQTVAFQTPDEELPPAVDSVANDPVATDPADESIPTPTSEVLDLEDVIASVERSYPLLLSASLERPIAAGKRLSTLGEFDLRAKAFGIAAPEGFYQTYRNGVSLNQPMFGGGYLYGGYKIGDGNFQPWYGERQTNEGGEFAAGFGVPLLKDRAIDSRRADLFRANLARQAVEPAVQAQLLEFVRAASYAYWTWVAAGQTLSARQELLDNAQRRVDFIEIRVDQGDLPRVALINNEQLIAARETKLIEAERKLQAAAIKLSLFYRGPDGSPVVPNDDRLLRLFPQAQLPDSNQVDADIAVALDASPLIAELNLIAEQVRVDLRKAQNMRLPKLDAQLLASQDVGGAASSKRDKSPFELEAGFYGEVPLQRREARGKVDAARAKLAQINVKRNFVVDKVTAAVQDAYSALNAADGRIDRAQTNLRLARETLRLGRIQFDANDINLIELNIYEQAVTDAQLLLISAHADFFRAVADYRAALAQTPAMMEILPPVAPEPN